MTDNSYACTLLVFEFKQKYKCLVFQPLLNTDLNLKSE